jgi:hypothetical protein
MGRDGTRERGLLNGIGDSGVTMLLAGTVLTAVASAVAHAVHRNPSAIAIPAMRRSPLALARAWQ